jgi:hypothetical protein
VDIFGQSTFAEMNALYWFPAAGPLTGHQWRSGEAIVGCGPLSENQFWGTLRWTHYLGFLFQSPRTCIGWPSGHGKQDIILICSHKDYVCAMYLKRI